MEHRCAGADQARLRERADGAAAQATTAKAASLHFGQGKWYPGEQLPRWSLNLFWRRDGEPIWHDPALFADERDDHGATAEQARASSCTASRSGSASTGATSSPAYEDVVYYLWRERKLPVNVDPFDSRSTIRLERERLRRVFDAEASTTPVGLRAADRAPTSAGPDASQLERPWFLRDDRCT